MSVFSVLYVKLMVNVSSRMVRFVTFAMVLRCEGKRKNAVANVNSKVDSKEEASCTNKPDSAYWQVGLTDSENEKHICALIKDCDCGQEPK